MSEEDARRLAEIKTYVARNVGHRIDANRMSFLLRLLDTSDRRAAAIEECAKVCEVYYADARWNSMIRMAAARCAAAIRALLRPADTEE